MHYERIYQQLVGRAQERTITEYTEKHHIVPRSLGGSNCRVNIVKLTAREHYVAHLCLWKMSNGIAKRKMAYAVLAFRRKNSMQSTAYQSIRFTSRIFGLLREDHKKYMALRMKGNHHAKGMTY